MSQTAGVHPIEQSSVQGRLGIQIPVGVEPGYEANPILREYLDAAQEHGLSVVEMNVVDYDGVEAAALSDFVSGFGLRLQNLATGGMAVKRGHALAHPDSDTRADAVATIRRAIDFSRSIAGHTGLTPPGIILGLVQGKSSDSKAGQRSLFARSLEELVPSAQAAAVALVIESTNRFLSGVSHTVEDSVELAVQLRSNCIRVLPDTFHMNIEERDMCAELLRHLPYIDELHVSENNRLYPGFGMIDFRHIRNCIEAAGFRGPYVIEGNLNTSVRDAIAKSVATLNA